jgi:hypothetical protein
VRPPIHSANIRAVIIDTKNWNGEEKPWFFTDSRVAGLCYSASPLDAVEAYLSKVHSPDKVVLFVG